MWEADWLIADLWEIQYADRWMLLHLWVQAVAALGKSIVRVNSMAWIMETRVPHDALV
jgi:hypothetical protein